MQNIKLFLSVIFTSILTASVTLYVFQKNIKTKNSNNFETIQTPAKYASLVNSSPANNDFTQAAEISTPAVVHVINMQKPQIVNQYYNNPFFDFFGDPYQNQQRKNRTQTNEDKPIEAGSGSGVIISNDGYIITNNHVIDQGDKIKVVLNDKREYTAAVIGSDANTDLALLKINETELPFINFGNSDNTKVGEWVLAVGNPFNLTSTVTAGIISAKGRNLNIIQGKTRNAAPIESFIQTDAAVNPGNSGGALVNLNGDLIGINTAIASQTGSYAGYAFAVPSNLAAKIVKDIKDYGVVQRGLLGVSIADINDDLAKNENIKNKQGVYVASVNENSAAADAGLRKGDVIRKIDGIEIKSVPELQEQVGRKRPGDKVSVELERNGEWKRTEVTLKNLSGTTSIVKKEANNTLNNILGAELSDMNENELNKLGIKGGVKVEELYSDGKLKYYTEIEPGFIITGIDKQKINNLQDLENKLKSKKGGVLIDGIYPSNPNTVFYYGIGI